MHAMTEVTPPALLEWSPLGGSAVIDAWIAGLASCQ
jgi:hypothetical protein